LKRVPKRLCIGCFERKEQAELIRIVRTESGVTVNSGRKADGRGAWICRDPGCVEKMVKKKGLDRTFRAHFSPETYDRIREEMSVFLG